MYWLQPRVLHAGAGAAHGNDDGGDQDAYGEQPPHFSLHACLSAREVKLSISYLWSMSRMVSSCIITDPVVVFAFDRRVVYVGSLVLFFNMDRMNITLRAS
jgi:hypothetical protein